MTPLLLHRFRVGFATESRWCAVVLLGICFFCSTATAQTEEAAPTTSADTAQSSAEPTDWATALVDAGLVQPIADELQAEGDWDRFAQLVSILVERNEQALLSDNLVLDALLAEMGEAPTPVLMQILTILRGDFRRDAIRKVIPLLDRGDPDLRNHAMRTLIDQTGREDLGDDPDAWKQWWGEHEWIPEIQWLRRVALWQSHRAKLAVATSREAQREKIQTLRELYSATLREKRPDLLLRLLRDSEADARLLGVELASREVVNATLLTDDTLDAAIDLLSDPKAELRAGAARLVSATTSARHHQSLSEALSIEEDPNVAGAFLAALSAVDPNRADIAAAVRWIADPVAQAPAARVLFSATESGQLAAPSQMNAVWKVIGDDAGATLGQAGVRLFGRIAPDSDIKMLFNLIGSSENALTSAAVRALAQRGVGLSQLIDAAEADSSLTPTLLDSISFWAPTAEGWRLARTLTDANDLELVLVAAALPSGEILKAATDERSATHRLMLLDRFTGPSAQTSSIPRSDLVEGVFLRLRALLEVGRYEDVLHHIETLETPDWLAGEARVFECVNIARLALGRFDEAEKADSQAAIWFEALDLLTASDSDQAPALARRFRQVWFDDLSDTDRERLKEVEKKLGIDTLAMPEGEESVTTGSKKG